MRQGVFIVIHVTSIIVYYSYIEPIDYNLSSGRVSIKFCPRVKYGQANETMRLTFHNNWRIRTGTMWLMVFKTLMFVFE